MHFSSKLSLILLTLSISIRTTKAQNVTRFQTEILYYINQHRSDIGLQPLKMNSILNHIEQNFSVQMANKKMPFSHDGFDDRIDDAYQKIGQHQAVAENIARGKLSAQGVVDGWLHSPGHKHNIEGDYNLTGIGVKKSSNGDLYFSQIFVR